MKRILLVVACCASGCFDWSAVTAKKDEPKADEAAGAAVQPAAPGGQAAVAPAANAPVGPLHGPPDIEARIVDKKKAIEERPQLFVTVNSITAMDPIFAPAQGLRAAGSKVEMVAFQNTINIHKATTDKYPTYEEFMQYYKDAQVKLVGLKPWQIYAYDSETGTICLMEDPVEKERIGKEWEAKNRL